MRTRASSLRFKLSVWYVLVFALIQVVFVLGVVLLRREVIRRDLDTELGRAAKDMIDSLVAADVAWEKEAVGKLIPSGSDFLFVAIRKPEGTSLVMWGHGAEEHIPFGFKEIVPTGPLGPVITPIGPETAFALTHERKRLKLITVPFRHRDQSFFFQAAVDDRVFEALLDPFLDLFVLGVPIGVLAAFVAAWIIAGRVVAPIRRLSTAAQRVSPERLDERFRISTTDHEISLLEEELNSALQRIEVGYAAQNQFISNVSHELKTPIAVLLTEAQVTRMGKMTPERGQAFVRKAEREMQRLGHLVESFLTLARADLPSGVPEDPVAIHDLVLDSVQHSATLAEMQGVRLVPRLAALESTNGNGSAEAEEEDDDPYVLGDVGLLQSAVENLVRNSIQHSPRGEAVDIEVRTHGAEVFITVRDRGPGIPAEHAATIFDRFKQVPERPSPGGSGLGLAITKHVVELHGGQVSLEEGEGCTITMRLPRMPDD